MTNKALEQKFGSKFSRLAYRYDIRTTFEALIDAILYNLISKDDVGLRKNPISLFDKKDEVDDFKECFLILQMIENLNNKFGLHLWTKTGKEVFDFLENIYLEDGLVLKNIKEIYQNMLKF